MANVTKSPSQFTLVLDESELQSVAECLHDALRRPHDEQPDYCDQYLNAVLEAITPHASL
jgi:hypothetical protein